MGDRALNDYDLAVVGLGAMGISTLETAVRRGLRVVGIEQYGPVHTLGGSHGRVRLIRKAYYEDPAYVPMVLRAYELWRELEQRSQKQLLTITGLLQAGLASSAVIQGVQRSAQRHGLDVQTLDAAEIARRFPMVRPLKEEVAVFEVDAGVLVPEPALEVQLALAMNAGAHTYFRVRVDGWRRVKGAFEIALSDRSTLRAKKVAFCCGSWLGELAQALGAKLEIRRKVQAWFASSPAVPAFLVDRPAFPEILYGFPDFGDGIKVAFHTGGERVTLDAIDRTVHDADIEPIREALETWMPGAAGPLLDASVCLYDMTPDENFIVGALPGEPGVIVASGFSGHGFKFSPVIGEIVTDLATMGATELEIGFLRPERLAVIGA